MKKVLVGLILTMVSSVPALAAAYTASAVPFSFADISGTGTAVPGMAGQDDAAFSVALGFNFNFYGVSYSSVGVSSNGLLTFGGDNNTFVNTDLTTSPAQASIAVYWDDLFITGSGSGVFTQTTGAAGSRLFTVQWNSIRYFANSGSQNPITFQAVLSESDGRIQFNYLDLVSSVADHNDGASATVGIKAAGAQGTDRLLLAFDNGPNAFVGTGQSTLIQVSGVPEPSSIGMACCAFALLLALKKFRGSAA